MLRRIAISAALVGGCLLILMGTRIELQIHGALEGGMGPLRRSIVSLLPGPRLAVVGYERTAAWCLVSGPILVIAGYLIWARERPSPPDDGPPSSPAAAPRRRRRRT